MLTSKQRAYLRGLANPIETILMIGKGEITDNIVKQADDAEAAELIAEKCGAEVVQVIGSKFVLYKKNEDEPKIVLPKNRRK